MEEEEALIEEAVEDLIGAAEVDIIGAEEEEVAAEAVLTVSKTTVLQNMLLVRSCKYRKCLKMGFKRKEAETLLVAASREATLCKACFPLGAESC